MPGHYETQDYWGGGHLALAHITILVLLTVWLMLEDFVVQCVLREGESVRLFTDNTVVMYTVSAMVSKSPLAMSELRRLHALVQKTGLQLQMHHLSSALNLYADRLSRRRRLFNYLLRLSNVPENIGGQGIPSTI